MKRHRINIIGASGTGKSTLAKALAARLQCMHFDSDDYYHFPTDPPFRRQRSPDERLSLLMKHLNPHRSWVLSGGAGVWTPAPQLDCSLVIFLYLPLPLRLERLREREHELYGTRIQSGGDMEKDHSEFVEWAAGYDSGVAEGTNTLPSHESYLRSLECVIRLDRPMTTNEQMDVIQRTYKLAGEEEN